MLDAPKLTICTPTFRGGGKFLAAQRQSLARQTVPVRHRICHGGPPQSGIAPDHLTEIVMADPDPGLVGCWNAAAAGVSTPYIGLLADDNELEPAYAERMTGYLDRHPGVDAVFCSQLATDSDGRPDFVLTRKLESQFGRDKIPGGIISPESRRHLLLANGLPLEAAVLRLRAWEKLGPFAEQARGACDFYFLASLLLSGATLAYLPERLMRFRWHEASYTARRRVEHLEGKLWAVRRLAAGFPEARRVLAPAKEKVLRQLFRHSSNPWVRLTTGTEAVLTGLFPGADCS